MQQLRFGICDCTPYYHKEFDNKVISVPISLGQSMHHLSFKAKEVHIPQEDQSGALVANRCHFFLDHHVFGETQEVFLELEEYVPHSRRKGEVAFGGWKLSYKWDLPLDQPLPASDDILCNAVSIMRSMDPYDLLAWILHLKRWWDFSDPRPKECRGEHWRTFVERARLEREKRLREYHCYPSCTSECHA